jgi:phosphoenolpyruvate carboxylase
MDAASRERFFSLVKADGFASWFATVTPMEEIGLLALGSRPARRGLSVESLEDLRAIPWVFAWSQARINLAGWFGLGTALEAVGDVEVLRRAYDEWPLFRTVIDNVGMSLAKADGRIARRYLDLGDRATSPTSSWRSCAHRRLGRPHRRAVTSCWRTSPSCSAPSRCAAPTSTRCRCCSCAPCARSARATRRGRPGAVATPAAAVVSGVSAGLQNTG